MHSCIYEGTVTHHRRVPVNHRFRYRLFMLYLDLDELHQFVGPARLIGDSKWSRRSFLRSDHLFDRSRNLVDELRDLIRESTGRDARGPIRLLTQLRQFGYYLSPLNLYFVFDEADQEIECVVAEVNNTPWKERHCYFLTDANKMSSTSLLEFGHDKEFHVSPFMSMDMTYQWRIEPPTDSLRIDLANLHRSQRWFEASMQLRKRELNRRSLRHMTLRYPWMSARIAIGIYCQALKLWWKKCPFHTHPKTPNESSSQSDHDGNTAAVLADPRP